MDIQRRLSKLEDQILSPLDKVERRLGPMPEDPAKQEEYLSLLTDEELDAIARQIAKELGPKAINVEKLSDAELDALIAKLEDEIKRAGDCPQNI